MEHHIKEYDFEIYTKNPETGETGWDIKFVRVYAATREEARGIIRKYPNFDCVITHANGGAAREYGMRGLTRELDCREYGG